MPPFVVCGSGVVEGSGYMRLPVPPIGETIRVRHHVAPYGDIMPEKDSDPKPPLVRSTEIRKLPDSEWSKREGQQGPARIPPAPKNQENVPPPPKNQAAPSSPPSENADDS
jgi:hypothetical protein